jgi:hypothetical protein
MPIADVELVMMTLAVVLAAQHFPCKVNDWEGLPTPACIWLAWKTAFCLAHLKRQRQILASGGENHLVGLRVCSLRRLRRSVGSRRHSTTLHRHNEQHCRSSAAHVGQSGSHGHHWHAHCNQQEIGGCGGACQGDSSCGDSSGDAGGRGAISKDSSPWKLLLDSRPLHQQGAHQCHPCQQGNGPPQQCHGSQHLHW